MTTNQGLVQAATDYRREELSSSSSPEFSVPLCITDWDLANLLWLKEPLALPDLPRRRVIADCVASLSPSDSFRRAFNEEIDKLEQRQGLSPQEVYALRRSLEIQRIAMDRTQGDESVFTEGTVAEVLQIYHENIRAAAEQGRALAELHAANLEGELAQRDRDEALRDLKNQLRAVAIGRRLAHLAIGVVAVALAGATILTSILALTHRTTTTGVAAAASVLVTIATLANWYSGMTLANLSRRLELSTAARMLRLIRRLAGHSPPPADDGGKAQQ